MKLEGEDLSFLYDILFTLEYHIRDQFNCDKNVYEFEPLDIEFTKEQYKKLKKLIHQTKQNQV